MSQAMHSNISMLIHVATHLEWLLDHIVFVGGATTELMLTEPGKQGIRPTRDVDVILEVASRMAYAEMEREIRSRGFLPRTEAGDPICRWAIGETVVDLMPAKPEILGFSNRWYPEALENWFAVSLTENLTVRVISPLLFLATKIEAFLGRGQGDFLASHDIEDIIMVLNGRAELSDEIRGVSTELKAYLARHFRHFVSTPDFSDAIQWSLPGDAASQARHALILNRMRDIIQQADD